MSRRHLVIIIAVIAAKRLDCFIEHERRVVGGCAGMHAQPRHEPAREHDAKGLAAQRIADARAGEFRGWPVRFGGRALVFWQRRQDGHLRRVGRGVRERAVDHVPRLVRIVPTKPRI